jgi:hypothetical protein
MRWNKSFPRLGGTASSTWSIVAVLLLAVWSGRAVDAQCEVCRLDPSDNGGRYGGDIALHENTALIAARQNHPAGSVYLVDYNGTDWVEVGKLIPSNSTEDALFGVDMALDGHALIVGAYMDESSGDWAAGSAYVYRCTDGEWLEEDQLYAGDHQEGDRFGHSVAISGDIALIGAPLESERGAVYAFRNSGGNWGQEKKFVGDDTETGDYFGAAIVVHGGLALVGATGDESVGDDTGAVYFFEQVGTAWVQRQKLVPSDAMAEARFGNEIIWKGDTAIISAAYDSEFGQEAGAAYAFRYDGMQWNEEQKLTASDIGYEDHFGYRLALDGELLLASAVGRVYIFRYEDEHWVEEARVVASIQEPGAEYGWGLLLEGDLALIGAPGAHGNDTASGAVYQVDLLGADCNGNSICDYVDIAQETSQDCNANAIPDECDIDGGFSQDCNENGIPDECDINAGPSEDCNNNAVPDECEVIVWFEESSGGMGPIGHGSPQAYLVSDPPPAAQDVLLLFTGHADLNESDEYIVVNVNGEWLGVVFHEGASECADPLNEDELTVPKDMFNELIEAGQGRLLITLMAPELVDPDACNGHSAVSVTVTYAGIGPDDLNGNGIPDECECPADINDDGTVNVQDLLLLLGNWGGEGDGDVNFDGIVNVSDLLLLLAAWGDCT